MVTFRFKCAMQIILLGSLLSLGAIASEPLDHVSHTKIETSDSVTVEQVLQAAMSRIPEQLYLGAYSQYASDQHRVASGIVAGAPRFNVSYWDDQSLDDSGLREAEVGIEFALWQRGQKSNAQSIANGLSHTAEAWLGYLQLQVAGDLRSSLHQLAMADARLEHANRAVNEAQALLTVSQKLLSAGAVARSATMQSEALVIEARQYLLQQQASQIDAERNYHQLTGLNQRPRNFTEVPAVSSEILPEHPQLALLLSKRQEQAAMVERERYRSVDNTTVSIGIRRERGGFDSPEIDSFGIAMSIPFGGGNQRRVAASAASIALVEADVQLQQVQRQLKLELHEVRHQLKVVTESMVFAEESRNLRHQHWRMAQKAFSLGASDIQPTILALRQFSKSELQLQLIELQRLALISSFKQTVGELP